MGFSFIVKVLLKVLNWFRLPNTDDKKSKEEVKMFKPVSEAEQDDWSRDGDYKQTYEECWRRQIVIFLFASSIMKNTVIYNSFQFLNHLVLWVNKVSYFLSLFTAKFHRHVVELFIRKTRRDQTYQIFKVKLKKFIGRFWY